MTSLVTHDVAAAAQALRSGGLVAFPTETVYGLGALADDTAAVTRIFTVKGRPADHPLIVHVATPQGLDEYARDVPDYVATLTEALWPGPLTVIVPRRPDVATAAAGGRDTIGVRCPSHPVAHELLTAVGSGVAAPSANRFGRVSPTSCEHVLAELAAVLDPERDLILDGGRSQVGVESTIVDCTGTQPAIVRTGRFTAADVASATGREVMATSAVAAPGTLDAHYAPYAAIVLSTAECVDDDIARASLRGDVGLLAPASVADRPDTRRLAAPASEDEYAHVLYAALRAADDQQLATIVAIPPEGTGIGLAVRDRLERAQRGSPSP